jgi:hypothetical protein
MGKNGQLVKISNCQLVLLIYGKMLENKLRVANEFSTFLRMFRSEYGIVVIM